MRMLQALDGPEDWVHSNVVDCTDMGAAVLPHVQRRSVDNLFVI
jgi:hypothetical protein